MKLLQNKDTKSIRVLLRQEKTLKLCMNHKSKETQERTEDGKAGSGNDGSKRGACLIRLLASLCLLLFPASVHPELELVPNAGSDRSWTWRTLDYSTEEAQKQTFALRFKDAESQEHDATTAGTRTKLLRLSAFRA